jgi:hypothetical protein
VPRHRHDRAVEVAGGHRRQDRAIHDPRPFTPRTRSSASTTDLGSIDVRDSRRSPTCPSPTAVPHSPLVGTGVVDDSRVFIEHHHGPPRDVVARPVTQIAATWIARGSEPNPG